MEERDSLEQRLYVSFCMHTQYNQNNDVGLSERWVWYGGTIVARQPH